MAAVETTDLYGFPVKLTELNVTERKECDAFSDRQQAPWMEYIEKDRLPNSEGKLKEMVRKGIPPTCRTWVWMQKSGAAKKKAALANNYYQIMVTAGEKSNCLEDIKQDAKHTFPSHPWLQSEDGQAALIRVLSAYSVHNDKVGYCRAMNVIVGLLLVAMNRNEENAFWLLAALVEDTLYPGTYSRNLTGCQIEMRALDELISNKLPRLHAHLKATDCDISIIATDWYLCLYATSLPAETTCRVWDALFNEGPKILYRVGLALLQIHEEALLACDNAGDIVMKMRQFASTMHHRDRLMVVAFDGIGGLPMATIEKFRDMRAAEVANSIKQREGASAELDGAMSGLNVSGAPSTSTAMASSAKEAGSKVKQGFGKFMTGLNKWAENTAESMAKAAEKVGIRDD
mmetsp:Transcript_23386/g.51328  ORF Transcript_23386/g.51328 Transcript_23386/m.51328 type:complete len:402 (-) Transcript_23386:579-1784(-)|eukprot:CAMPEP_0202902150 /NCGR_PEP_ID=MMETSP1392-20130828/16601_1 /ASSEMBLY_ACC=CAM_ASM_000868 /TAXON_ID=225041 /ORGANISM="Chlamydomonas chlamydogama, Strain SAG 11-48b" /LENGTH=401 /DNA_ID=CAMNT_0049588871 /DNA_START=110 /DNA_END=1315 /DNA_ORIENTATION=+